MAEELFYYLHPFLFTDVFETRLNKYQFEVLFQIIQVYSFTDIRKEFHFQQFIDSYPAILNGKFKRRIKEHFIQYLQVLENQRQIQSQVLLLPSNRRYNISQLTYTDFYKNQTIVGFEIIDIKFL